MTTPENKMNFVSPSSLPFYHDEIPTTYTQATVQDPSLLQGAFKIMRINITEVFSTVTETAQHIQRTGQAHTEGI